MATDPKTEQSLPGGRMRRQAKSQRPPRPPWWQDRKKQVAAGAGGLLLVLLGVWVIVRDKGGREVARVAVPEGGSATVETATDGGDAKRSSWKLPAGAPPPAIAPFDATKAKEHQAAWAKYLGVQVEMTNSIGMKFMLIPPGEFDMGSTEAEVAKLLEQAKATKQPQLVHRATARPRPPSIASGSRSRSSWAYEVTQAEYERVVGSNPSQFKGDPTSSGGNGQLGRGVGVLPEAGRTGCRSRRRTREYRLPTRGRVGVRLPGGDHDDVVFG